MTTIIKHQTNTFFYKKIKREFKGIISIEDIKKFSYYRHVQYGFEDLESKVKYHALGAIKETNGKLEETRDLIMILIKSERENYIYEWKSIMGVVRSMVYTHTKRKQNWNKDIIIIFSNDNFVNSVKKSNMNRQPARIQLYII